MFSLYLLSDNKPYCEIYLALKVLTTADRLRDTLIHEMCHAASWIISGKWKEGHGKIFQAWGEKATNTFPELPLVTRCHNYVIQKKFKYVCTHCGFSFKRAIKSINPTKSKCGKCAKKSRSYQENPGGLILYVQDKITGKYVPLI